MLLCRRLAMSDGLRNERLDYEDIAGLMGQLGSGFVPLRSYCPFANGQRTFSGGISAR